MGGRIRSLKPEMAQSEALAEIPRETLFTWVMLWPQCDDYGHHLADPRLVWAALYPLRTDTTPADVAADLEVLEDHAKICRYVGCDGKAYLHILGWTEHQRIDNAGRSKVPPCSFHEADRECPTHAAGCPGSRRLAATRGDSRLGPRTTDLGPRTTDLGPEHGLRTVLATSSEVAVRSPGVVCPQAPQDHEPGLGGTQARAKGNDEAELVFEAWKEAGGLGARVKLTDDRRRKISGRLREYPVEDLVDAVRGIWESEWHRDQGQTDLALALRDAAHLERFRDTRRGLRARASPEPMGAQTRALKRALEDGTVDTELLGWAYGGEPGES